MPLWQGRLKKMASKLKPVENIFLASATLIIPRMLYRGVILYFCWRWFMLDYGFPPLDYFTAAAMGGVLSVFTLSHMGEVKTVYEAQKKLVEWLIAISTFFAGAYVLYLIKEAIGMCCL